MPDFTTSVAIGLALVAVLVWSAGRMAPRPVFVPARRRKKN